MFSRRLRTLSCVLNSFNTPSVLLSTQRTISKEKYVTISTTIGIDAKLNVKLKQSDMQM